MYHFHIELSQITPAPWLDCNENLEVGNWILSLKPYSLGPMKTLLIHHKTQKQHNLGISFALLTTIVSFKSKILVFFILVIFSSSFSLQSTPLSDPHVGPSKLQ